MEFLIVSLRKILELNKNNGKIMELQKILGCFSCKRNKDEEAFIRSTGYGGAINFEKENKARTYLIVNKDNNKFIGYFSLAIKTIELNVSKNQKKKISAGNSEISVYPAYLLGHLAKDDSVKDKIGCQIVSSAIDLIYSAQDIVGGRIAYLDCKNIPKLIDFYTKMGFKYLGKSQSGLNQYYITLQNTK